MLINNIPISSKLVTMLVLCKLRQYRDRLNAIWGSAMSLKTPAQSLAKKHEMDRFPCPRIIFCVVIGFVLVLSFLSLLHFFGLAHVHSTPFLCDFMCYLKGEAEEYSIAFGYDHQELSGRQYYRNAVWKRADYSIVLSQVKAVSKLCIPRLIPNLIVPRHIQKKAYRTLELEKKVDKS